MSSNVEGDGEKSALVEPEGVNAGGPVDRGPSPAERGGPPAAGSDGPQADPDGPGPGAEGQGDGELLSGPGSDNGITRPGPGQETSAGEG